MKTGEPYEELTMLIFKELLSQSAVPNLVIEHDVHLKGKTTTHQIDVLWEIKIAGIRYLTLIQAKDWSKPVDQGEVLKFRAILDDVPGQPRGVMVARNGFQAGAQETARNNGIKLYGLREAEIDDRPRGSVVWDIRAFQRRFANLVPILDREWFLSEVKTRNLPPRTKVEVRLAGPSTDLWILAVDGTPTIPLSELILRLFPLEPCAVPRTRVRHDLTSPGFLPSVVGSSIPLAKVIAVEADVWTENIELEAAVDVEAFAKWLLTDIIEGRSTAFDETERQIRIEKEVRIPKVQWLGSPGPSQN